MKSFKKKKTISRKGKIENVKKGKKTRIIKIKLITEKTSLLYTLEKIETLI